MTRLFALLALLACFAFGQETFSGSADIDAQVQEAIGKELIPGAVVIVGHEGRILHRKAYGSRALIPSREAMTLDTIFDAASLTKVIATTTSLMKLYEQGKLRMNDKVTQYLPEFQGGKSDITIRDLLTHFSGLRPDLDLQPSWTGYQTGIRKALLDVPAGPPGTRFVYSDINFILLGEIVHRLSGKMLNEYAAENIFMPLGMTETMFRPPESLRPRIAPTEIDPLSGRPLRGVVHDETSRDMGGVAGHAGLFTTAEDLCKFAEMMLGMGMRDGVRIVSPLTVRKFTTPETPADQPILRGFGWDIDSPFASNRGELFPLGSYGHTGFTGTSLWIDPATRTYIVILSNSVHPHRGKSSVAMRAKIATIAAAGLGIDAPGVSLTGYNETIIGAGIRRTVARNAPVQTGLDVLAGENFARLKGKRVALFTNHTGLSQDGRRNIDLLVTAKIQVTSIFSPEHGIAGVEDRETIDNTKDAVTGIPIVSLYQPKRRRPTPEMFRDVDALVFDIQDVGARFYTYSCSLIYAIEEASKNKVPIWVLDRPNPITGVHVDGPVLESNLQSFVGCFDLPVRHGMTFGELARMVNGERKLGAEIHVVPLQGWQRGDWFDSTDMPWINPSPNMRSLNAALLYPGVALLEAAKNYSVGRGTDAPFEQIGADWIHGRELSGYLNTRYIPGVRFYPTSFTPLESNFAGKRIEGVRFVLTDREAFDSFRLGLEIGVALEKFYPGKIDWEACRFLIGSRAVMQAAKSGQDPKTIITGLQDQLAAFVERRKPYLLYK